LPVRLRLVTLCLLAVFSAGCGSSSSNTTVSLRIVQASPDAPASKILIDGTSVASNAVYGNNTGYQSVKVGSRHLQVIPVSGSSAIFDQSVSVSSTADQTLLLTGAASAIKPVLLNDGGTTSITGDGNIRVINVSLGIPAADVYVIPAGTGIAGVTPIAPNVGFDGNTGYQLTAIGNYEVIFTAHNSSSALLDTGPLGLTQGQNQTVLVLDGTSGGFNYTVLTDQ
jgi:hypothetical protein